LVRVYRALFLSGTLALSFSPASWPLPSGRAAGGHGGRITEAALLKADKQATVAISRFQSMSIAVFLAWFGGTGYLLVHLRHIWVFAGLALPALPGLRSGNGNFLFVAKFLMARDFTLDPRRL